MKRRIAQLYISNTGFADGANQTIGAPGITEEALINRRFVTSRLNDIGRAQLEKVRLFFKEKYGIDVSFKWNIKCGCSMCPCSPGFDVKVDTMYHRNLSDDKHELAKIWFNNDGEMDFREPKSSWNFNEVIRLVKTGA